MISMQEPGDALHVLIIGAGTVGLLVAQALKKEGIKTSIFEAEPGANYYRAREWGTSIQWALPLVPQLLPDDLWARFRSTAVDPLIEPGNSMPTYNAQTGEVLKQVTMPRFIRVSRHKFRALCAEGIDIQYGKCLLSANATSTGVEVGFGDGTTAIGSVLIGADGARSTTRNSIYGPELGAAQGVPYKAVNMHVHYNDAAVSKYLRDSFIANKIMAIGVHPRGYWLFSSIQDVPDESHPETWIFQLLWTWPFAKHGTISSSNSADTKVTLAELKKVAEESFGEPYRTAWSKILEGTPVYESKISVWSPIPIPSDSEFLGRAALVGDAAHAMSFHRGQGLNHGIADAVSLVDQLKAVKSGSKGLKEAMGDYESEMCQRAGEEVKQGKMNTEMLHDWEKLMDSPFMRIGGAKN